MKKILQKVGAIFFYIYLIGFVLIATPYFNWKYASEHGFGRWLAFGEIVATSKAAIWPYYLFTVFEPSLTSEARSDQHYINSKRASDEALKVILRFGDVTALPPKETSDVIQLLDAAVTESKLVQDSYLQNVHPEFLRRYRDDYIVSLKGLVDGLSTGDRVTLISAAAKYNNFSGWMISHEKELRFL